MIFPVAVAIVVSKSGILLVVTEDKALGLDSIGEVCREETDPVKNILFFHFRLLHHLLSVWFIAVLESVRSNQRGRNRKFSLA